MDYASIRKMLRRIAEKAGIKKAVNPHNFRHSRATFLANHLTEAQLDEVFGWVQGSRIPGRYVHLSGRDVDKVLLKLNGVKEEATEQTKESSLKARRCPRCGNLATDKFCGRCGAVLDVDTAIELQDKMKELDDKFARVLQDKEVQQVIIKKIRELGIH